MCNKSEGWTGITSGSSTVNGCDGKKESTESDVKDYCGSSGAGDGNCEQACGASPECDEKAPGESCGTGKKCTQFCDCVTVGTECTGLDPAICDTTAGCGKCYNYKEVPSGSNPYAEDCPLDSNCACGAYTCFWVCTDPDECVECLFGGSNCNNEGVTRCPKCTDEWSCNRACSGNELPNPCVWYSDAGCKAKCSSDADCTWKNCGAYTSYCDTGTGKCKCRTSCTSTQTHCKDGYCCTADTILPSECRDTPTGSCVSEGNRRCSNKYLCDPPGWGKNLEEQSKETPTIFDIILDFFQGILINLSRLL